ncbi:MAG: hypothetical protein IKN48_12655 [Bacteroidaceae bacterium]|nr:hypothetical protein [Bacteroidaceae bacterium]
MKKFCLRLLFAMLAAFSIASCSSDDVSDSVYSFGLTSAINGNNSEIEAIEKAYSDAYKMKGIKFNSQMFALGTSKEIILKACKQAEDAIESSSTKYDGRYVYEVKSKDVVIYQKVYGIRK